MPTVEIHDLGKRLRLGSDPQAYGRLTESLQHAIVKLTRSLTHRDPEVNGHGERDFWALRGVSAQMQAGEVVGLIGHNGAGKTTLLRVLSNISPPTEGWARLNGRVGSLLDVGTGFHPELTGRENIFLYGAVLGMTRREVKQRFDEIVEFAEVSRFIDTPLKRYSSGMYLRLGFAVAAHLEPEILFVDEILAVGDLAFQQRCVERMAEIARGGTTIIFVSHNLALVSAICSRACLLERGRLIDDGPVHRVLDRYTASVQEVARVSLEDRIDRQGTGAARFSSLEIEGERGPAMSGDDLRIGIGYQSHAPLNDVVVSASVFGALGEPLLELSNRLSGDDLSAAPQNGVLECTIPRLPLAPGRYSLSLELSTSGHVVDSVSQAQVFDVVAGGYFGERQNLLDRAPLFFTDHTWRVREYDLSPTRS